MGILSVVIGAKATLVLVSTEFHAACSRGGKVRIIVNNGSSVGSSNGGGDITSIMAEIIRVWY